MDRTTGANYVTVDGKRKFSDGPPGTCVDAEFLNSIQEEIVGAIEDAGITPDSTNLSQLSQAFSSIIGVRMKVVEIGTWNMDSTALVNVAHGLTFSKIKSVRVLIRNDADTWHFPLDFSVSGVVAGSVYLDATNAVLQRVGAGYFDDPAFDNAGSFNRGWIVFEYVP